MAKSGINFKCTECGHIETKWLGKCPSCLSWNTFEENTEANRKSRTTIKSSNIPRLLSAIKNEENTVFSSGITEFDRVLGGGLIKGSSVLIGGEPGIGKSTLLLQAAAAVSSAKTVLYISAEESLNQIKMRATRLGLDSSRLYLLSESNSEIIEKHLNKLKPDLVIIDSIQMISSQEAGSVPGTVNQLKYCSFELISWVKENGSCLLMVAHVTKEGSIAGPKILEHMVDSVFYFDQSESDLRILRSVKNRFGAIDEIGLFLMNSCGLKQIEDSSCLFLTKRNGDLPPGTVIAPVFEGTRVLLIEIQALTVPCKGSFSRIFSDRIDSGRVSRTAAVLEKHIGIRFSDQDIYINIAGGLRINEVGIELPLAIALYSARSSVPVPGKTTIVGELSLAGEVKEIQFLQKRIKAADKLGYNNFIGPTSIRKGETDFSGKWHKVKTLKESISACFK